MTALRCLEQRSERRSNCTAMVWVLLPVLVALLLFTVDGVRGPVNDALQPEHAVGRRLRAGECQ
jgi:hypothetical protein